MEEEVKKEQNIAVTEYECRRMNLPRRYWTADWNIIAPENQDIIRRYVAEAFPLKEGKGLLLYGDIGRGKTYMSVIIAKFLRKKRYHVYFISADDLNYNILKNSFDEQQTLSQRIHNVDLLIIDDISDSTNKDLLYSVLKYRNENLLSTILTMRIKESDIPVIEDENGDKRTSIRPYMERFYNDLIPVLQGNILPIAITGVNYREKEQTEYAHMMFPSQ